MWPSLPAAPACTLALAVLLLAGCAATSAGAPPAFAGGRLVDGKGMTLYTRDRDVRGSGKSNCDYPCDKLWPPALAPAGASAGGDFTIITRDDGTRQWVWRGWPLYGYLEDEAPGEAKGDGYRKAWHVVRP